MSQLVETTLSGMAKHAECPYIFCYDNGKRILDVRKSFATALKKSGIINFHFHDLRHTFASQLVMAGVDLYTVKELLGQKTIEMTMRYAHLAPSHKQRAVDVLVEFTDTAIDTTRIREKFEISQVIENELVAQI